MESYYDRRQRLVSVFEDTQKRIAGSCELQAAQLYSIEHQQLILGAFGCGAFCNDPKVVAQAYKNVLPEFIHHF